MQSSKAESRQGDSGEPPPRAWDASDRARFLGGLALFAGLPPDVLQEVAAAFRAKRAKRGSFIFLEGQPAQHLHLVAEGRVKVMRETDDGREVILTLVAPGGIFGAAGGWGQRTYPASAVALEDSVILQLASTVYRDLMERHQSFAMGVTQEIGSRLREAHTRIGELQTERVERRIARTLLRLANKTGVKTDRGIEIGVPLSRQNLADLAGTTLSTASRTLSAWDAEGIVASGRERVTIVKPHALVTIAEDLPGPAEA